MRKKLLSKLMLLLCALLVGSASAWAEEVVFDFTQDTENYGSDITPLSNTDLVEGETTFTNGDITFKYTTKGGGTNLRWWSDGIRAYSGNVFTIEAASGEIESILIEGTITIVEASTTGGTISSNTWTKPSAGGVTAVSLKGNHTSKNKTITKVTVTYTTGGGGDTPTEKTDNDLTLTGAPIALNFDLYNNAKAQTISYTTSSTGEVSVEAGKYDVSCYVDNDAKTITVTPMAVTNGVQTVTVKQAADANYKAGSVTFTVTVTDSTPVGDIAEETITFSELGYDNADDVTNVDGKAATLSFDKGSNTSNAPKYYNTGTGARMYNGNTLTISSSSKTIESIEFTFDGSYNTLALSEGQPGTLSDAANSIRTWEGSASSIEFTTTATNRIKSIKITYADDTLLDPALTFSATEAEATFGQDFTAPTLNAAEGFDGTVEYSSSVETVALVMDTETGELRIVGGGTTVITATFAGNDTYKKGSASYTLTVKDNRVATTISQENIILDLTEVATLTQLTPVVKDATDNVVKYTNSPTAEGLPEVYFDIVSDDNGIFGSFDSHGNVILNSVTGTATIKAVYNQYQLNSDYRPSECTFTITIESALNGIAAFCGLENGSTGTVRMTDAVVLYANGNDMFVRDNTGAIDFYNTGLTYEAGNILNGKITATYKLYNNMNELTTPISNNTLVATAGSAVTPTEITTSDATDNACNLVKLSGVTVTSNNSKFYVDDVQVYDKFKLKYALEAGKTYDIVGIMVPFNSIYEICPTEAPVEVVVTTPSIALSTKSVEATAAGADGTIEVTYNNIKNVAAEVYFYDSEGALATYDWVTAEINEQTNNVDYVIGENTSTEARTAYLKVYALDDEANDVYSELITITQEGYKPDYATLPFSWNDTTKPEGVTNKGVGTYSSSPYLKFDGTGDEIILKLYEEPGMMWFDIKGNSFSGGTFTVQTSADGKNYIDLETYTELGATQTEAFSLDADVRYIKWVYTTKDKGNVALGNIIVDKAEIVTVGDAGYATYVTKHNVSFPAGVTAYIGKVNGENVTLTEVAAVAKGTALVLKGTGDFALVPAVASALADVSDNELLASDGTVKGDGNTIFALGNKEEVGFYLMEENETIPAGKAYLQIAADDATGAVREFLAFVEGETNSIRSIDNGQWTIDNAVYSLSGQRVQKAQKGIYIVNGKKVVIK